MTNPALERAARALQDEIERQVAEPGYLGWGVGQEDHRPPLAKTHQRSLRPLVGFLAFGAQPDCH